MLKSTLRSILMATAATLAVTACGGGYQTAPPGAVAPEDNTTLRVENQSLSDMRIYVWRGGQRIRLGTANLGTTANFKLPRSVVLGMTSIRVLAEPIAGHGTAVSEELTVSPGDDIVMRILP